MTSVTNSSLGFYRRSQVQMASLRTQAETLQDQLSTGQRIARSSQDPVAAAQLRSLARADRLGQIDTANAKRASDDLNAAGSALEAIANDIIRARELSLWAASDTIGDKERQAIGAELDQLRMRLLASANNRDLNGNALFGGEAAGDAYSSDAAGTVTYAGTASSGEIVLGDGQSVARGLIGPEFLSFSTGGTATDIFAYLADISAALQGGSTDPAGAARAALGGFDDALDAVTRAQTVTGARIAWIDVIQDRQTEQAQTRAAQSAETGGVEFASTVAELQQLLTVLEASQAGFARMSRLSLFDAI